MAAEFPPAFVHRRADWPRPHVDLAGLIAWQLRELGVADVAAAGMCTLEGARADGRFFSHRADGTAGGQGRGLGFIALL